MPKRKGSSSREPTLSCLDAALDILACDTFTSLSRLTHKFETAAGIELSDGVAKHRWEEACKRYWVTKAMEDLCCSKKVVQVVEDQPMEEEKGKGRALPDNPYPGAIISFKLNAAEESEWRKWRPKLGEIVLVELATTGVWPGKIIDKKTICQGRSVPRGNHFFCVRVYSSVEPTMTVKSRMIPFDLRPDPPLLASEDLLTAYHHAQSPDLFDSAAITRENIAAHNRTHPGVGDEPDRIAIKEAKDLWNASVNFIMNERRIEKLRALNEDREKKLRSVAKTEEWLEGRGEAEEGIKKRRVEPVERGGIFKIVKEEPNRLTPPRHGSPRRFDKRRSIGELSPRFRGTTYTPPRILPSGDETAPQSPSPAVPTLHKFDFCSPLGSVKLGKLTTIDSDSHSSIGRSGSLSGMSLEAVKEEPLEDEGELQAEWTLVQRSKRSGSLPCS